ncbi:hypothetical protein G7Y31_09155 [Corynebacterium lizhenjunii]|uniref:PH domain-containing protein n=1 Tax=Corynebacterium lizhenjunii TaxID=2709394 RepID=A0A7T0KDW3_9CORY|nr:hypothetical protein [Corynebacterium lizhenjunii]QPK78704.1 hypothetical protein G7Y31_09155 [Corynebacterium lizhenjunii]
MNLLTMRPGEHPVVNVTAPFRSLVFPALELMLITGLCWMAIGWLDAQWGEVQVRNAVVVLWAGLGLWRGVLPVFRARRRRFMVTNTRVIARNGKQVDSIPLHDIAGVRRRRGGISLAIRGYERPLYYPEVPKAKKIERTIEQLRQPVWH